MKMQMRMALYTENEEEWLDLRGEVSKLEQRLIRHALIISKGNVNSACRMLGIFPASLGIRMRKYNISARSFSSNPDA